MKTQGIAIDITPRFNVEALIVMAETYEQAASVLRDGAHRLQELAAEGPESAVSPLEDSPS